ncbi:type 1 glutamine amidotransferase [Anianabacter salinae]|uniref:type 1 glutamine amidotransferase n=1 Tax=Anianabacter salinae TaxID=2851023 RepID=UPI00225E132A|nr:type 1 glutamine amidotransferase [Anianabacter salinae]MBV0912583.1 type 1 glutamine amidotransferase [Anianabacter salinae]
MKIGILQCGHPPAGVIERHGEFSDMFARLLGEDAFTYETWNVVDMVFPGGPEDADGWLITGSRHGAYDALPFIKPLEDLIRAIAGSDRPLVGICFGHQIIAQAMGGRVEKFKRGWSVGATRYDWTGMGQVALTAWHQDQVVEAPQGARTIASSDFCAHAALVYGDDIFTIQPHPEFASDIAATYVSEKKADPVYPEGLIETAETRLDTALGDRTIGARIAGFLKERTAPDA